MLTIALLYLFPVLMIGAALWDVATLQIPNWLSLAVLACFLLFAASAPLGATEVLGRLGLGVVVLGLGAILFAKGLAGGGDIKLLAAAAVWFGWQGFPHYLIVTAISGGVLALALLAYRKVDLPPSWASVGWLSRLHNPGEGIPYGVALGVAGVLAFRQLPLA